MKDIKIKLKKQIGKFKAGTIVKLWTKNTSFNKFWLNRLKDNNIDNSLDILDDSDNQKSKSSEPKIKESKKKDKVKLKKGELNGDHKPNH